MAEYIDREAVLKKMQNWNTKERLINCVEYAPKADAVEVVRCEKCKHKGWVQEPCHGKSVDFCRIHETCIRETDFCSYGERKE